MNNKEFITALSQESGYKIDDTQNMVRTIVNSIISTMGNSESVVLEGLGTLEVKKRMERVIVNPGSGQRMLVPPKLVAYFKPEGELKEKLK